MTTERVCDFLDFVDERTKSRTSTFAFEFAYQARLAVDRIKFAIQKMEGTAAELDPVREATFQLLDALDRLQSAEHHFQQSFRRLPGLEKPASFKENSTSSFPTEVKEQQAAQHA